MNEDDLKPHRRTTRMDISIPIVISGKDDNGRIFSECVRTLAVNKHGGQG